MSKKLLSIAIVAVAATMASCGNQTAKGGDNNSTVIMAQEEMTGLIKELYAAEAKNEGGIDQLYACHVWRKMVAAVNEKDSHVAEIGFFNDDYWTQMQDSNPADLEARDIKFEQLDVEKGRAVVSFILHSSVQTVCQKFEFCHEDGNWRVHNIISYFEDDDGKEEEDESEETEQLRKKAVSDGDGHIKRHEHELVLTESPYGMNTVWICDVCSKRGRRAAVYHCEQCGYDLCKACHKKMASLHPT